MLKLKGEAEKMGLEIDSKSEALFHVYLNLLQEWNQKFNLTSITEPEEIMEKHFLDCLTLVPVITRLGPSLTPRIIDVGSGAGFPGLVVKIALPEAKVVLLEAKEKKAGFLQEVIKELKLDNVEVIALRAEEVAHSSSHREAYDFALSRAVAKLPTLSELTLPFCNVGGYFIAQKKGNIKTEIDSAQPALTKLGGSLLEIQKVKLPTIDDERYLVIIEKVHPTPPQYPRRPGIPAKKPLH